MKTLLLSTIADHHTSVLIDLIAFLGLILIWIPNKLSRKRNPVEQRQLDAWHEDPENWKAGIFYFNPKDKRLFLPIRSGFSIIRWNFGNPYSALILVIVVIMIFK